jgi:hypothetical protein
MPCSECLFCMPCMVEDNRHSLTGGAGTAAINCQLCKRQHAVKAPMSWLQHTVACMRQNMCTTDHNNPSLHLFAGLPCLHIMLASSLLFSYRLSMSCSLHGVRQQ